MKNAILLLLALQVGLTTYCQRTISIRLKDVPLATVLATIEKQSEYRFYYSNDVVPANQTVQINTRNAALRVVMTLLLEELSLSWKLIDERKVIIYKKENVQNR